jgi:serine/threonine protein kinase
VYDQDVGAAEPLTIIRERYRLDALIGEGGMAGVWRAWDLTLQRPVAVKLLFARDARDEEALVARFLREARIAASVQHRNVIHIVDFGTTPENQPFMVMELLEGETLAARLRREKRLIVSEAVQIANLTLRGLSAVHAAGIIHRDLKPDNVYLKAEAGMVYPKILDFGISRSIDSSNAPRSALTTRDGVIVGTPEYMSPEQARGVKRLDYRTDLYSMGVVLYEALTGRLPYSSENVGDLIIKIVGGGAPRVHELVPEVPQPISEVVARAMSRNAGERFPDAVSMQESLLEAAAKALGARAARALSDLPPQQSEPVGPLPHLRATARPPRSPLPRDSASQPVRSLMATTRPKRMAAQPGIINVTPPVSLENVDAVGDAAARSDRVAPAALGGGVANDVALAPGADFAGEQAAATAALEREVANPISIGPSRASLAETGIMLRRPRWYAPVAAAGGVALLGLAILWLAPAPPPPPVPKKPPPSAASTTERRVFAPPAPLTVKLTLRGVPDQAKITLDGEPASSELELSRDNKPRSLTVSAPGKTPWHIAYVPNADQELQVELKNEPPSKPKRAPAQGPKRKPQQKAPSALRVPDF